MGPIDLGNKHEAFAINSSGDVLGIKLGNSAMGSTATLATT